MNYFTRRSRQQKTAMIGRSVMQQMQEPPRVKMICSHCEAEAERLTPVAMIEGKTVWLCDGCRKGAK